MPRYKVTSIQGWPITHGSSQSGNLRRHVPYSWSVIDTLQCHQEVGRFYAVARGLRQATLEREAHKLCDRLNQEDETLYGPYDSPAAPMR